MKGDGEDARTVLVIFFVNVERIFGKLFFLEVLVYVLYCTVWFSISTTEFLNIFKSCVISSFEKFSSC